MEGYGIMKWFGLEGTLEITQVHPVAWAETPPSFRGFTCYPLINFSIEHSDIKMNMFALDKHSDIGIKESLTIGMVSSLPFACDHGLLETCPGSPEPGGWSSATQCSQGCGSTPGHAGMSGVSKGQISYPREHKEREPSGLQGITAWRGSGSESGSGFIVEQLRQSSGEHPR